MTEYKEALGIATGDIVTTSYNSGPYRVESIWGPKLWHSNWQEIIIWPYPIVCLGLRYTDPDKRNAKAGINNIHREGDQYFNANGDEIFVRKPRTPPPPTQISLFSNQDPKPYPFQSHVDYYASDGKVWHCSKCGEDFNADRPSRWRPPDHCGGGSVIPIIVMGNGQTGNECIRSINV